jgi:rSAM/selenodomain-associated transferase 2
MISVIIPAYNEEGVIGKTIQYLRSIADDQFVAEIIVVDGRSTDNTVNESEQAGALVIKSLKKGRAAQMNEGARYAKGSILYFLHADSIPPTTFAVDIAEALKKDFAMGCYRLRFDVEHWFLKANAWFTRFDVNAFRYGDQSLFVSRKYFDRVGGFSEKHIVFEDYDIIKRLRRHGKFAILKKQVVTSARKYVANGIFKMQGIFYLMYVMYRLGYSQDQMLALFRRLVRQDKL